MVQFNMPSCPALPLPPPKRAVFWCVAHPIGKLIFKILRQCKENLVGVSRMSRHHFLFCIFRMKSWKNLYKDLFDHSKTVFVFLSVLIFLLPSSFYQLNGSLAKSTHNHHFLSLRLFAWKETAPIFVAGIGQLAVPRETVPEDDVMSGFLGLWKQ